MGWELRDSSWPTCSWTRWIQLSRSRAFSSSSQCTLTRAGDYSFYIFQSLLQRLVVSFFYILELMGKGNYLSYVFNNFCRSRWLFHGYFITVMNKGNHLFYVFKNFELVFVLFCISEMLEQLGFILIYFRTFRGSGMHYRTLVVWVTYYYYAFLNFCFRSW